MLNIASIITGVVALLLILPGLLPLFGWLNWLALPVALVGVVLGALSQTNTGRNLCIVLMIVSGVRLFLGGGLI